MEGSFRGSGTEGSPPVGFSGEATVEVWEEVPQHHHHHHHLFAKKQVQQKKYTKPFGRCDKAEVQQANNN